jgi:hypothetical protein
VEECWPLPHIPDLELYQELNEFEKSKPMHDEGNRKSRDFCSITVGCVRYIAKPNDV